MYELTAIVEKALREASDIEQVERRESASVVEYRHRSIRSHCEVWSGSTTDKHPALFELAVAFHQDELQQ